MQQRTIPVYRVDTYKDEVLPQTVLGLGGIDIAGKVFEACPVVVATQTYDRQPSLPFNDGILDEVDESAGPYLRQLSSTHRRSFEVIDPSLPDAWEDEYGNFYSSINLKGNNFSMPTMLPTSTATDGIIAFGLQESAPINRILRGSAILRAAGVSTEYIIGLAEPQQYPLALMKNMDMHKMTDREGYKSAVVHNYWKELPEDERTIEKLAELHQRFQRITFYITMRAMDTSYRMYELVSSKAREHVFAVANARLRPEDAEPYDAQNPADRLRFVREVTVPRLAKNLAGMHSLGLAHKYPNDINITALGGIVDLDSLRGEPLRLDDPAVTAEDVWTDVLEVMKALEVAGKTFGETSNDGNLLVRMEFAKLYADELLDRGNNGLLLEIIAKARSVMIANNKEDESDRSYYLGRIGQYVSSDANSAERFLRAVTQESAFETAGKHITDYNDWLRVQNDKDLIDGLNKALEKRIDTVAQTCIDEYYGLPIRGKQVVLIDTWLQSKIKDTYDQMIHDIIRDELGDFYLDSVASMPRKDITDVKDIYNDVVNQLLLRACNHELVYDEGFAEFYEQLYAEFTRKVREKTTITLHPSIFGDDVESYIFGSQHNGLYARENSAVELTDLFQRLDEISNENSNIVYYVSNSNSAGIVYEQSHESLELYEVITDGFIEAVFDQNSENRHIEIETSKASSYMAFVEGNKDGTLIVHIWTISNQKPELPPHPTKSLEDVRIWLADKPIGQGTLFDANRYISQEVDEIEFIFRERIS